MIWYHYKCSHHSLTQSPPPPTHPSKTWWSVSSSDKEESIFILCPHLWFWSLVLLWCAVFPPAAACRRGQQGGGELQGASLQGAPPGGGEPGWRRPWPRCSDRGRDRYRWKLARALEATGCSAKKCRFAEFRFDLFSNQTNDIITNLIILTFFQPARWER